MTKTLSSSRNASMSRRPPATTSMPVTCGRITRRKMSNDDAPSARAASYCSRGIACMAAKSSKVVSGVHSHVSATTRPVNAVSGLLNPWNSGIPTRSKRYMTGPTGGADRRDQAAARHDRRHDHRQQEDAQEQVPAGRIAVEKRRGAQSDEKLERRDAQREHRRQPERLTQPAVLEQMTVVLQVIPLGAGIVDEVVLREAQPDRVEGGRDPPGEHVEDGRQGQEQKTPPPAPERAPPHACSPPPPTAPVSPPPAAQRIEGAVRPRPPRPHRPRPIHPGWRLTSCSRLA